jgi:hypothetical protein
MLTINCHYRRYALREVHVNRLALAEPHVEFVGHLGGALLDARAAGGALRRVNVARFLKDSYLEAVFLLVRARDFAVGEYLNVGMPTDIPELGREYSHRAVVGRESLVKLRHDPADAGLFLNEVGFRTHVGKVEGGLYPCYPAANHGNRRRHSRFIFSAYSTGHLKPPSSHAFCLSKPQAMDYTRTHLTIKQNHRYGQQAPVALDF